MKTQLKVSKEVFDRIVKEIKDQDKPCDCGCSPFDDDDDDDDCGGVVGFSSPEEALNHKGIFYITGPIRSGSLQEISQNLLLKHLDPSWKDDVQFFINSPGGTADEGWAFLDLLSWIRMDVRTIGIGQIASFGSMILAAGTKGKRVIAPNTTVMVHNFSAGIIGKYNDLISNMKEINDEYQKVLRFWKQNSKYKTNAEIEKHLLKSEDVWLTPQEAINHGIADYVMAGRKK